MSEIAALKRQLKIKSGAAKRLLKENGLYRKETEDLQRKHDKMIADGAEEWDLKNAKRLVEESNKMVTDTSDRMGRAVGELRDVVIKARAEPSLAEDEDFVSAEAILEEAAL
ncbi:tubulin binding cofactor A-domain-containing protein [Lentinula raphanica]|uniref:Tubulin-specific chaperone A n=1 Tax=Lentinula raphanica TaxID=153919 RepID=A0AA38PMW9_9AGAR|nr:tubulin binding cofactor A-domain-containing protein [Lentinula raphanica]KAJ3754217.1 tubulin binding cofactor A-domain-containing protein [Lentinula raphanica]KAJ3773686.1 tubulin binding cofactor A-domain-containing protein [Lentinula raphanica]KAJ3830300.1 tubulin binding cofactor A-domain-containing protein [Lentinula raphanica]KAJ3845530.1 tubulin binding cofactor A-domain-containing protein [Lentinula raphanica]